MKKANFRKGWDCEFRKNSIVSAGNNPSNDRICDFDVHRRKVLNKLKNTLGLAAQSVFL